jgi:hypothetical protein
MSGKKTMRAIINFACVFVISTISFSSIADNEVEATKPAIDSDAKESSTQPYHLFPTWDFPGWDFSEPGVAKRQTGSASACQKINAMKTGAPESSPVPACGTPEAALVPCCKDTASETEGV